MLTDQKPNGGAVRMVNWSPESTLTTSGRPVENQCSAVENGASLPIVCKSLFIEIGDRPWSKDSKHGIWKQSPL
jgi:hypothetical protein